MLIDSNLPSDDEDLYSMYTSTPYAVVPVALGSSMTFVGVVLTVPLHGFVFVFPNTDPTPVAMSSDEVVPSLVPP